MTNIHEAQSSDEFPKDMTRTTEISKVYDVAGKPIACGKGGMFKETCQMIEDNRNWKTSSNDLEHDIHFTPDAHCSICTQATLKKNEDIINKIKKSQTRPSRRPHPENGRTLGSLETINQTRHD